MDTTPFVHHSRSRMNGRKLRGMATQKTVLDLKSPPLTEKPSLVLALCCTRLYTYIKYEQICSSKTRSFLYRSISTKLSESIYFLFETIFLGNFIRPNAKCIMFYNIFANSMVSWFRTLIVNSCFFLFS